MHPTETSTPVRAAAVNGLAVVGFIALVGAGMWLAVYSAKYVPSVVSNVGAAAAYLSSAFSPAKPPALSVVPTASTTIPFSEASSTPAPAAHTPAPSPAPAAPAPKPAPAPTAGQETTTKTQISGGAPATPVLSGLPDLTVTIEAVGYLASSSPNSFVATTTIPAHSRPAVKFAISNIGTNVSGTWRFSAIIPTAQAYAYQSQPQQSLNPGDRIEYTLGFDQAKPGANQTISIYANYDHAVAESDTNNDSATATLTILGS